MNSRMKTMPTRIATLILALLVLAGCTYTTRHPRPLPIFKPAMKTTVKTPSTVKKDPAYVDELTPQELQAAIMAFADTSNSRLTEAAMAIEALGTPQARLTSARMMVYNTASNIEIASGPFPGVALLDMVVLSTLRRMTWEDYWTPQVFGDAAQPVVDTLKGIEKEAWELAAKVMDPEQEEELMRVIRQWRVKYPDIHAVNYVRFDDFGELGLKPSMRSINEPGGLFDSVKEAAMVAQDMKIAIDRAFYLASRMQLLLNFQIKLAYLEMLFQPEADGIIDATQDAMDISDRFADIAEDMPEDIREEASILMAEMFREVERQSNNTLAQAFHGVTEWQDEMITNVMTNISKEREAAINQAVAGLVEQQAVLFTRVDDLVNKSGGEMEETLNHAFMLAAMLIVLFFVLLTLYKLFVTKPRQR